MAETFISETISYLERLEQDNHLKIPRKTLYEVIETLKNVNKYLKEDMEKYLYEGNFFKKIKMTETIENFLYDAAEDDRVQSFSDLCFYCFKNYEDYSNVLQDIVPSLVKLGYTSSDDVEDYKEPNGKLSLAQEGLQDLVISAIHLEIFEIRKGL